MVNYFKLERGVWQLLVYFFILAIKVPENKIHNDQDIKFIIIENKVIKISPLVDDIMLILKRPLIIRKDSYNIQTLSTLLWS